MKLIDLTAIRIAPDRQRRSFPLDKLLSLGESIRRLGLQNPIVLRIVGDEYQLVSGERRLRAIQEIYDFGGQFKHDGALLMPGTIPYTLFSDLDPLAAEEAELEENTRRENLSWQEEAKAVARLTALRNKQAEAAGKPPVTTQDIAEEIKGRSDGGFAARVHEQLVIARHLDDTDVAAAPNHKEAFKVIKKKEEAERNRALGERVGRIFSASFHQCHNASLLDWLPACSSDQFDVILTDPPYGMGAHEFGDSGDTGTMQGHGYEDTFEGFRSILDCAAAHSIRITRPQAHLYWFCDIDNFFLCREAFAEVGWQVFRTPLIWVNQDKARAPWPTMGPQRKYECILYAVKGKKSVTRMAPDVLDFRADSQLGHSAQKPVGLYRELLARSVVAGSAVLDLCCGTGPIFPAAHELKCRATGLEMDQKSYGIAVNRITKLKEAA